MSSIHWDIVKDLRPGGRIELDGETGARERPLADLNRSASSPARSSPEGEEAPLLDGRSGPGGSSPSGRCGTTRPSTGIASRARRRAVRRGTTPSAGGSSWAGPRGDAVENPFPVLRFGVDKERYLTARRRRGVPVVPTAIRAPGTSRSALPNAVRRQAGNLGRRRRSARFEAGDPAAAAGGDQIIGRGRRRWSSRCRGADESSLVYLDGAYSHSLRRVRGAPLGGRGGSLPRRGAGVVRGDGGGEAVAEAALALVPAPTLYARVDLLGGLVLELEVVEPSLYLSYDPTAADRLAEAVECHFLGPDPQPMARPLWSHGRHGLSPAQRGSVPLRAWHCSETGSETRARPGRAWPAMGQSGRSVRFDGGPRRHARAALRDLRISVTDRCNFRCVYCMPKEVFGADYRFLPRASC